MFSIQIVQDPVLVFSILMITFLFAPLIAEKLKIPDLVLLLIAGLLFGEHGFDIMKRDEGIEFFGSIGLLYIMFVAGLETDSNQFKKMAKKSGLFGFISFFIPQLVGAVIAKYTLNFSWESSILLASMFASHTLISYPIASKFGIAKSEPVAITVGGTILTNTLSLLVLAVIVEYHKGGSLDLFFWLKLAVGLAVLTFSIWIILPILAKCFFKHVQDKKGAQFLFVLGMVCVSAYWSHYAKMEPIIGAFLAGVAFNRLIPAQSTLMNRLLFVGNTFFIPFFLISVGMLIDPRALIESPKGALVAVVMSVTVIFTKYISAYFFSKINNYSKSECRVMFGLSVPQAAATLAAVLVGCNLGIFDNAVLNGTVIMILISCTLGCFYVDKFGRDLLKDREALDIELVNLEKRIMLGVFNPATIESLLDFTLLLRNERIKNETFVISVVNDNGDNESSKALVAGEKLLEDCQNMAAAMEVDVTTGIRLDTNPADGLIRANRENRCSLLIMGWSEKSSLRRHILNGVTENLLEDCQSRLMFCRFPTPLNTCKRVVLPIAESGFRRLDLRELFQDAKQLSSQIGADLHVVIPADFPEKYEKGINKIAPQCKVIITKIKSWGKYEDEFFANLSSADTLFLPLERRESGFWRPRFERFIDIVNENLPTMNLIASYPQLVVEGDNIQLGVGVELIHHTEIDKTKYHSCNLQSSTMHEVTEELINLLKTETKEGRKRLIAGLNESLELHPFELSEQVILLHTRSKHVRSCHFLVGYHQTPYHIAKLNGNYRIVIALISPRDFGNEQHLTELANLARKFVKSDIDEQIRNAKNANELLKILF